MKLIVISPILRQLDPANFLTLLGLISSLISAIFSIQHQFYTALIFMILAGIVDLFDGFVARKIQRTILQSETGQQLDSIVDVCSFGFNPAIFAYCFGLQSGFEIPILMGYISATALRLAYFNCNGLDQEGEAQYFTGMPVTYAALFIPMSMLLSFNVPTSTMTSILCCLYLLLAAAMVSSFKILKLRGIWYRIFALGAIAMSGIYLWAAVCQ
jgi:CDP-diacylglycerol---serine O-phosphatidyltransferase